MATSKVVVTDLGYSTYEPERKIIEAAGAELILTECETEEEIIREAAGADALITRRTLITAKVIESLTNCRIIIRYGVGYDNIDTKAAADHGIPVCNVPDYCMEEVSDQALGLMLSCARKITVNDKKIRQGAWNITGDNPVYRIRGKVMGIVGLGRIGKVFLRKVRAFEFGRILVCDPYLDQAQTASDFGVEMVHFDELVEQADFISLHVPLTGETRHMINAPVLGRMKTSAMLVNTSRGPVVDLEALYEALRSGQINSAGIDVWEPEPPPKDSPLFTLENIVVSDHAAWYSEDSEHDLKVKLAETVADALTGKGIRNVVNGVT